MLVSDFALSIALLALVGLLIVVYTAIIYNNLVNAHNNIIRNWANIDVLLVQRNEELSKCIDACAAYGVFEQGMTQQLAIIRTHAHAMNVGALNQSESDLRARVTMLFALAEQYPALMTNTQFVHLQARISTLEQHIADRSVFYNESVLHYNNRLASIPDGLVGYLLRFKPANMLSIDEIDTCPSV